MTDDHESYVRGVEVKTMYAIVNYAGGDQCPEIVSRHRTREGAERAFRRRNPWLFRSDDENGRLRTRNYGTFDRIETVEK